MADQGTKTSFEPGLVQRVAAGIRYAVTGRAPSWFGPGEPIAPAVQDPEQAGVAGRLFDYPSGYNLGTSVRQGEAVTFAQMRGLADGLDLLRIVIETRKDQLAKVEWQINARPDRKVGKKRLKELNDFFIYPDKEHSWDEWLRALLEDMFVIDAACLYVRRTRGGDLWAFEPVDGATIKRILSPLGRTPEPPLPAYQQVLKGFPAVDYTRDELIYRPRNFRTHKVYGYSPVEQIIMTVNIALRRQIFQLQYYTEGNVPEALIGVPESWSPDQIRQFQDYWDYLNAGNTASRRHAKFVPGGLSYTATKESVLKDQYDEWLARVICFCFSLSHQAFVKEMNRATAEQSDETATKEGLLPLMGWIKRLVDYCLDRHLGAPECELSWLRDDDVDPLVQAQIDQIYIGSGILTVNEVRGRLGMETIEEPDAEIPEVVEPQNTPDQEEKPPAEDEAPLEKRFRLDPVPLDRPVVERAVKAYANRINSILKKIARKISDQLCAAYRELHPEALEKAGKNSKTVDDILEDLDFGDWKLIFNATEEYVARVAADSGKEALKKLHIDQEGITDLVHERAVEYAKARAAELVGKRYDKATGTITENPNVEWVIEDATRDMLRGTVARALEEGPSVQALRNEIIESHAFSAQRADTIARTELAFAHSRGSMDAYQAAKGLGFHIMKEWSIAQGDYCEDCQQNADAGPIELNESFPSGDSEPPLHPNCRCAIVPVVVEAPEGQDREDWK